MVQQEEQQIKDAIATSKKHNGQAEKSPLYTVSPKQKIIFDTDIGTDIDDALALLMLLHLPLTDYELLGITTVYGPTALRARIAETIVNAWRASNPNAPDIPIVAGAGTPYGSHRPVWVTGMEGRLMLPDATLEELKAIPDNKHRAAKWIIEQVTRYPGEVVILALGGLTNIAYACILDKDFARKAKHMVWMALGHRMNEKQTELFPFVPPTEPMTAGAVHFFYPNHNVSQDTWAAVRVVQSGITISIVSDYVTNELWFAGLECQLLMKATAPAECKVVGQLLEVWLFYRSSIFYRTMRGTCPHDAITTAEALYPDRFAMYVRGRFILHEWAGFCAFVVDPHGPHRIGMSLKKTAPLPPSIPAASLRTLHTSFDPNTDTKELKKLHQARETVGGSFTQMLVSALVPPAMTSDYPANQWPPKET